MTVNEMIEALTELADEGKGECEVKMAIQPSYPLIELIKGVVDDEALCEDEDGDGDDVDRTSTIFLVSGGQPDRGSPYAPRGLWSCC